MSAPLSVSIANVRHFLIHAFLLARFQGLTHVSDVLHALEFVQEDSIHVCGRIHDLILWSRIRNYTPAMLNQFLYIDNPRRAFEFYLPNLCVISMMEYPYFVPLMHRHRERDTRWGKLTTEEEAAAEALYRKLDTDGPLFLRDAKSIGEEHGHTTSGWGTKTRLLSFVADKLFWQGHLGIAQRDGFLRAFDRIERLYPAEFREAPVPSLAHAEMHMLRKRLRARRIFRPRPSEMALLNPEEITPIQIDSEKRPWFIMTDDLPHLTAAKAPPADNLHLLAPLDPLVYDRDRTRLLWDFDYTWEVYVPATKRKWGYYVLPVLYGDRLVGRIEPRIDKRTGTVTVLSQHWESGFEPMVIREALQERLNDLARLAG